MGAIVTTDEQRQRFEARFGVGFCMNKDSQGLYIDQRTYGVWLGWSTALDDTKSSDAFGWTIERALDGAEEILVCDGATGNGMYAKNVGPLAQRLLYALADAILSRRAEGHSKAEILLARLLHGYDHAGDLAPLFDKAREIVFARTHGVQPTAAVRDDDPQVGEPVRSAAWHEWKATREFYNWNTTEQHAGLNFAAGFKAGVKAALGVEGLKR